MTNIGTTLITVKQALKALLEVRPYILQTNVQVSYGEPGAYNITSDAIWFTVAEALHHEIAFGQPFPIKEDIHLTVICQAFTMTSEGFEDADLRCVAMMHELENVVSENATSIPGVMMLQLAGWQHFPSVANAEGSGYLSRFEVQLRIRAQLN